MCVRARLEAVMRCSLRCLSCALCACVRVYAFFECSEIAWCLVCARVGLSGCLGRRHTSRWRGELLFALVPCLVAMVWLGVVV